MWNLLFSVCRDNILKYNVLPSQGLLSTLLEIIAAFKQQENQGIRYLMYIELS